MKTNIATDDLTERIAGLSPAKWALLEQKLKKNGSDSEQAIPRRANRASAPLSFAQQRLWFLNQLEPGSYAYNIPWAIQMSGALNVEALHQSLDAIVARHEPLRTTFASRDEVPMQVIAENESVAMPVVDLQSQAESEQEAQVRRLAIEEAQRSFNLAGGPLVRATLLRLSQHEHVLLLTLHHIISDAWSAGVLFRELTTLYEAFSLGRPSPLTELPIQYADYAVWQREWLQGKVLERQLAYWKRQLAGAPAMLELPTDRPRPAVQSYRGAQQPLVLSKDLSEALKALCQQKGATLFMTLLAAFQTLLHRYTGQDDIVVGSAIANRTRAEVEELIGFFLNTLALRTDLSGDPSFAELLERVRESALGAYAHQDLPFERVVEELQPERSLSLHPLFQVMFTMKNASQNNLELQGLSLRQLEIDSGTTKFDLTLYTWEETEGLRGSLEYNTDLFDAATITRMVRHFQVLLEGIVADPEQRLSKLPLITEVERYQLLMEWNNTTTGYPIDKCIHELFEAQVERTPEAVAVVFEDRQLTYRELNRRANQLAHYLRKHGVGPEVLVGIMMERSPEMVVGLLGILKAGGAYVPLDLAYPQERLSFMLKDANVRVLMTQEQLIARLPEHVAKVVCLEKDWEMIARESEENPVSGAMAENLAYVIYTSGSTGMPKGVCIPHGAVNRLVLNTNYVELGPSDKVAQASNSSFDAATFEIWGALLHGAQLVGITKDVALSPRDFATQIRKQNISAMFLTTALFNQLAGEVPWIFNSVRHLLFGGEAVDPRRVEEVLKGGPPERLLHVYGPTESTTFASWYLVQDVPEGAITIPIGRPISNTEIYLLDRHLNPVPIGVRGELHISGDGLARGYLNRPALTAERFIPHPFSNEAGARLYKTGDVARYLPDGNIEYLGRLDDQVKVRGHRIELGEIEAVLGAHPGVREAVVIVREDAPGDKRLVAYVIVSGAEQSPNMDGKRGFLTTPARRVAAAAAPPEPSLSVSKLRNCLREKLPDYMVPSAFVMLDEFPLTPNGKVARRALPAPEHSRSDLDKAFIAPRTTLELQLAKLWEKLLGTQPVGIHDNFFDLGGHSLLAVRLFDRMEKTFGKHLPLATLFQAPTVAQLAEILSQEGWSPAWSSLVTLKPDGSKPPFICAHGGFFFYSDLLRYVDADQPFYGVQPEGVDLHQVHHLGVEEIAAQYVTEVRRLQPAGPYYLGGFSFGGWVAYEMAQQLYRAGQRVGLLILFDTFGPGYPRFLPMAQRIRCHAENVMRLRGQEKLRYVQDVVRTAKPRIRRRVREFTYKSYLRLAEPLPRSFREVAGEARLRALMNGYVPQAYPGRITLLRAETQPVGCYPDAQSGWGGLAAGGIEIHEIPGGHGSILQEPHVRVLAEKLSACLQKAHAAEVTGQT